MLAALAVPRHLRVTLLAAAAGLLGGVGILALIVLASSRLAPTWWRTVRRDDPATIQLARAIEHKVTTAIYERRDLAAMSPTASPFSSTAPPNGAGPAHALTPIAAPPTAPPTAPQSLAAVGAEWTIEIDAPTANAWLNVRLPLWLANQRDEFHWPREMTDLQVAFHPGRITIGARVRAGERLQVITATVDPHLDEHGRLWLPASAVSIGRFDVPGPWVVRAVRGHAMAYVPDQIRDLPETRALVGAFEGRQAVVNSAVFRLGDGRRVRVLAVEPRDGLLVVRCRTEHDAGHRPAADRAGAAER